MLDNGGRRDSRPTPQRPVWVELIAGERPGVGLDHSNRQRRGGVERGGRGGSVRQAQHAQATRCGRAESEAAHEGINRWVALFSSACRRAVDHAAAFEAMVERIHEQWRATLGRTLAGSAVERLLATLPGAPVVSFTGAAKLIGRSFQANNEVMKRLEAAGIVRQVNVGRRNRAFEPPAVIDALPPSSVGWPPRGRDPVCTNPPPDASATTVTRTGPYRPEGRPGHSGPRPQPGASLMMLAALPQVRRQGCALPASGRP